MKDTDTRPWEWQPDLCPADQDFIKYVITERTVDGLYKVGPYTYGQVLHMGTGNHHRVGYELNKHDIDVIGLTLSPKEYASYIVLVENDPKIQDTYLCLYGDINYLNFLTFKPFDLITCFHLCEIDTGADVDETVGYFVDALTLDGKLVHYRNSANASQAREIIQDYFIKEDEYASLDFYVPYDK